MIGGSGLGSGVGVVIISSFSVTIFHQRNNISSILRDCRKLIRKAMASRYERDSTYNKSSAQFFWYSVYNDVADSSMYKWGFEPTFFCFFLVF